MIDLHLHLLPSVDDGPQSMGDSLEMLGLASTLGFSTLVATPHLQDRLDDGYQSLVTETYQQLIADADRSGIEILRGFEIRIDPALPGWLEAGDPITLAGTRTVLVELPFAGWPTYTDRVLFDVMAAGYRVLLAHPERYAVAMQQPDLLFDLHDRGVLFQVTTGSLAGLFGNPARDLAERLLRRGMVDVLASDAHSAGRRFVSVSEGLDRARELVGADAVQRLTVTNPHAILNDAEIEPLPMTEIQFAANGGKSPFARVRQLLPGR